LSALETSEELQLLQKECRSGGAEAIDKVLNRVRDLCGQHVDYRYEHPFDTAIAAYLLILRQFDKDVAAIAAGLALQAHELWWGHRLAERIIDDSISPNATKTVKTDIAIALVGDFVALGPEGLPVLMAVIEATGSVERRLAAGLVSANESIHIYRSTHQVLSALESGTHVTRATESVVGRWGTMVWANEKRNVTEQMVSL